MDRRALGLVLVSASMLGCVPAARHRGSSGSPVWQTPVDHDPFVDARTDAVLRFAYAQVGKNYCWGGAGPTCFDCSGLVQSAWGHAGVLLPRTSEGLGRALPSIPPEQIRPGDILWWPGHVGIYVGAGTMIDAYHSRAGVVRRPAKYPDRVLRVM